MYYPVGWPRVLHIPQNERETVRDIVCNRDRTLFAVSTDDSIGIWYTKPAVLVFSHRRSCDSLDQIGNNLFAVWRTDGSMLAIVTSRGHLIFFELSLSDKSRTKSLYCQIDSKIPSLQRESAELFVKDPVPAIQLTQVFDVKIPGGITRVICVRDELVVSTDTGEIERYHWDGRIELDVCYDLAHIPFYADQQNSRVIPVVEHGVHVVDLEYSPTLGGFAIVLSDGRGALMVVPSLRCERNEVRGLWAMDVQGSTCVAVNHKCLLVAYGTRNGQVVICHIDEVTGGLIISHKLLLGSRDYPDATCLEAVRCARWTPDGCALLVTWQNGGLGMWSVYGALLLCTLGWDYGLAQDLTKSNPLLVETMDWGPEGYQLWLSIGRYPSKQSRWTNHLSIMQFVKSALTVNPCVSTLGHVMLQGDDRIYLNTGQLFTEALKTRSRTNQPKPTVYDGTSADGDQLLRQAPNALLANKQWMVVMIPSAYNSTNWPIRYVAIDKNGRHVAVAGRTGVAHCCLQTKKWKLFGNETQEKDFIVTGSLLWWKDHLIMGCYNIQDERDEVRLYPRESKLDNFYVQITKVNAQILLMNIHSNRLAIYSADSHIVIYSFISNEDGTVHLIKEQDIDISNLSIHPVCVSHVVLMSSRSDVQVTVSGRNVAAQEIQSLLVNVCGKVVMFHLTAGNLNLNNNNNNNTTNNNGNKTPVYVNPTVLASCVENLWVSGYSGHSSREKKHLVESVLFACGSQGMKVWLPLFPRDGEKPHNFMSKWIMLPLKVSIYPLTVLFEDAVILGVENDTVLYPTEPGSLGTVHPFSIIERTSQVYLHHILRQLLRRNLGFHAWEIARSCTSLSYFPHALELLLHEVLEEEATSKEPIPDALLPRVVEFIREFPVYLQTVVQCARKIEIALWPYLFATVGQPCHLFHECLQRGQLATGASYLIILQNMESSSASRQYANKLLDSALDAGEWELCKDLVRFLKAIDPSDVESPPRSGFGVPTSSKYRAGHQTQSVTPVADEMSFVLGTVQVPRMRTYSVTGAAKLPELSANSGNSVSGVVEVATLPKGIPVRKKSIHSIKETSQSSTITGTAEEFFLDVVLQRHARRLLADGHLKDLGCFAAYLDFHLVAWLRKERSRAAKVDDFVSALKKLHQDFQWPYPVPPHPYHLPKRDLATDEKLQDAPLDRSCCHREDTHDSGYLSHPGLDPRPNSHHYSLETSTGQTLEAQLRPHTIREDESIRTLDMSEESSLWGEADQGAFADDGGWSSLSPSCDLEQMSAELASKGPQQFEIQLRYLLQLMMEANCLEWAVLISVVLRDAMAVIRIVNAARAADVSPETTTRLREGLASVEHWADKECLGYRRFMHTIRSQSVILSKLSCSKLRIRPPSPNQLMDSDNDPSPAGVLTSTAQSSFDDTLTADDICLTDSRKSSEINVKDIQGKLYNDDNDVVDVVDDDDDDDDEETVEGKNDFSNRAQEQTNKSSIDCVIS